MKIITFTDINFDQCTGKNLNAKFNIYELSTCSFVKLTVNMCCPVSPAVGLTTDIGM